MRKIKLFVAPLLAVMTLFLVSCTGNLEQASRVDSLQVANLIPNDAAIVVKFDAMQVLDESGVLKDEKVQKRLKDQVFDDMPKALREKAEALIEDPAASGVDPSKPVLFYFVDEKNFGFVGALQDRDLFEETINMVAKETDRDKVEEAGDISYMQIDQTAILAFDDARFIITPTERDLSKKQIQKMLEEKFDIDESILSNDNFVEFASSNSELAYFMNVEAVLDIASEVIPETGRYMNLLKPVDELKNFDVVASLAFEYGETVLSFKMLPKNDKGEEYLAEMEKCYKDISGDHFKYVSADAPFVLATGLDGAEYKNYIKKMGALDVLNMFGDEEVAEFVDMYIDVLSTVNGDVTIALSELSEDDPQALVAVNTEERKIFDVLKDELAGVAQKKSADNYVVGDSKMSGAFGVEDETTYFVIGEDKLKEQSKSMDSDDFNGYKMFACLFVDNLMKSPLIEDVLDKYVGDNELDEVMEYVEMVDKVTMSYDEGEVQLKIVMKDSDVNILGVVGEVLIDVIKSL
jgi:hypothetical protein